MQILITGPDGSWIELLQSQLSLLGDECSIATQEQAALTTIEAQCPEIVICSHHPPDFNGVNILKAATAKNSQCVVLLGSKDVDVPTAIDAVNYRAFGLFSREIELRDVLVAAERWVKDRKRSPDHDAQHSRLALEYARLRSAYDDLKKRISQESSSKDHP